MILRKIICDICNKEYTEAAPGDGWPGWGRIDGVEVNGNPGVSLCPEHLDKVKQLLCELKVNKS